ncbi:flagellar protein FlgN [Terracoccus sp. 273MFTsu3.1]|uniref:flagellar protein FlgN n=1 Tax=Terracoccus sp. 273MFTsu3.1 TaxID=1172188 RepID=UPI00037FCE36|nr:flagellar protein FlgN [Terracoccus sp. 273MFTsu3.1]
MDGGAGRAGDGAPGTTVSDLSARLWYERELLDLLTFKLEEEQLLLTAGRTRWVSHATREVEQVLERLQVAGLERAAAAATVAHEWGLSDDATLRDLAEGAGDTVWGEILAAHLAAMTDQTAVIRQLRDANAQFLRAAARSTQETLATTESPASTYDAQGRPAATDDAHLFDRSL